MTRINLSSGASRVDQSTELRINRRWQRRLFIILPVIFVGVVAGSVVFARFFLGYLEPATSIVAPSRTKPLMSPRASEQFGTLRITTNVDTARVFVDDQVRGIGKSVVVRRMSLDVQHAILIRAEGYTGVGRSVRVEPDKETVVSFELYPMVKLALTPVLPAPTPVATAEPPKVPVGPQPFTPAVATLKSGELVWVVGNYYHVPACLLWGIWKKETSLLESDWRGDRADWFYGAKLVEANGLCIQHYSVEKCTKHWRALVSLCKQERDGAPICNPDEVHTSYALAVGPMQHMPGELVKPCADKPEEYCFTGDAVDFDADGVVDPWKLPDAVAMTALELRNYYEQSCRNGQCSWRWAANRYYGSQRGGYYDGAWKQRSGEEIWRDGVKQNWAECCSESGRCRAP